MKKLLYFLPILLLFTACEFDLFSDLEIKQPEIKLTSISYSDGLILLNGEIIDDGGSEIEHCGFYHYFNEYEKEYIEAELTDNIFTASLEGYSSNTVLKVQAVAANEFQCVNSPSEKYTVPISYSAPCRTKKNILRINNEEVPISNSTFNYERVYDSYYYDGFWYVIADFNGGSLSLKFSEKPSTKKYNTEDYYSELKDIAVTINGSTYSVYGDHYIYVEDLDNYYTISFCEIPISYDIILTGKFDVSK